MKTVIALSVCLVLTGCHTISPTMIQKPEKYQAAFDYTPPTEARSPHSADVTFTIANPTYKTRNSLMWFASEQFAKLHGTLKQDLQKILVTRGFGIRGPYSSRDLIPYQDKKEIDLYLVPTLDLYANVKVLKQEWNSVWVSNPTLILTGNVVVGGNLKIELKEIVTDELVWVKIIPIKDSSFPYTGYKRWQKGSKTGTIYNQTSIYNEMAKNLEQQYPEMMGTLNKLIDPEEMKILESQAMELKKKRGY